MSNDEDRPEADFDEDYALIPPWVQRQQESNTLWLERQEELETLLTPEELLQLRIGYSVTSPCQNAKDGQLPVRGNRARREYSEGEDRRMARELWGGAIIPCVGTVS